jgi:hypothetical protein
MSAADIIGAARTLILRITATAPEVILQVLKVSHVIIRQPVAKPANLDFSRPHFPVI